MKTNLLSRNVPAVLGLVCAAMTGFAKAPENTIRIKVLLYDYVNLPLDARTEMSANAVRVLGEAGLTVEFIECSIGGTGTGRADCAGRLGPDVFVLRICQPKFAEYGKQLGYAVMAPEDGAYITVFIDPARRKTRVASLSDGTLLGHSIAHEIGHLLLGANAHSSSGIMRPAWRPCDEEWMAKGVLYFDGRQAMRMQAAVLKRARQ